MQVLLPNMDMYKINIRNNRNTGLVFVYFVLSLFCTDEGTFVKKRILE